MEIPVYLYLGFLEGGKTTKIRQDLTEGRFAGYKNILLLQCEDGIERLDESFLDQHHIKRMFLDLSDVDRKNFEQISKQDEWDLIIIEYHGIWPLRSLIQSIQPDWKIEKKIVCANAAMLPVQYKNMDRYVAEKIYGCDELYFHSTENAQKATVRSIVKTFNVDIEIPI